MQCLLSRNRHGWQLLVSLWLGPVCTAILLACGLAAVAHSVSNTTVTNTDDSGPGSLRQAIADVAVGGTIVFDSALFSVPQTITLSSGYLDIAKGITIDGAAGGVVTPTISGPGAACGTCFRVFRISANVTLRRLAIVNGKTAPTQYGGGIYSSANLTLENCLVTGNVADGRGGGIYVSAGKLLTLIDTDIISNGTIAANANGGGVYVVDRASISGGRFQGNSSITGGGAYVGGSLWTTSTEFAGNTATAGSGGGVYAAGELHVTGAQFLTNSATSSGGAAYLGGAVTMVDTKYMGNRASVGGGLYFSTESSGRVANALFARNTADVTGAAVYFGASGDNGSITLAHTTVASPTIGTKPALTVGWGAVQITDTIVTSYTQGIAYNTGSLTSDYNLFYNAPSAVDIGSHSIPDADPLFVDPAADDYHLMAGSPAAGSGSDVGIAYDLDGVARGIPPTIGAYEGPHGPQTAIAVTVQPLTEVAYQAPVTYTLVLSNLGSETDAGVLMTDVLPTDVAFARWVEQPPGALQVGNAITWTGSLAAGAPVTVTFAATNTASAGTAITNTAWFSGSQQAGHAAAAFTATTSACVFSGTGVWSAFIARCAAAPNAAIVIPVGSTVTLDADIDLGRSLTVQGTLVPNGKTVTLTGSGAQTLTGSPVQFYKLVIGKTNKTDRVRIVGKLKVDKKLTISRGSLISASDYEDIEIEGDGVMTLTNPISISGSFTNAGELITDGYTVTFDGGVTQNLVLDALTQFDDVNVMTGTVLVEAVSDDNALVNGTLTNYGVLRKTQPVSALEEYYFGLAGRYSGADMAVDVATVGTLTSIQVDRTDSSPTGAPGTTPLYWQITPVGGGYSVTLTLPYAGIANPSACRRVAGSEWDCAQSQFDATTVTRQEVTAFSDWAVFALVPSTTTLTASPNPAVLQATVTITADIAPAGAGGSVQFFADGAPLGSARPTLGSRAVLTAADLALGTHAITATTVITAGPYLASIGLLPSPLVVNKIGTTTAVTSSANPAGFGQVVTFTATVTATAPGGGTPVGAVTFNDGGSAIDGCETITLSSAVATCGTNLLAAGPHTITAEYAGSATFLGSTSPAYRQTVGPQPVAVNDAGGTLQDRPVTLYVLANDLDPAGGGLIVTAITLQPAHGAVQVAGDGKSIDYTPEAGFSGHDSFVYVLADANGNGDDALVTIVVTAQSQADAPPQIAPVDPKSDDSKQFTSPMADVEVELPGGFFTDTLTEKEILFLSYTPIVTPTTPTHTPPANLKFGNFEFDLTLIRDNEPQHGVQFAVPLTVTIVYDPELLNGLREDLLEVYFWDGTAWVRDGITVLGRDPINHTITFLLAHLSHFAFFSNQPTDSDLAPEPQLAPRLYLPGVMCGQQAAEAGAGETVAEPGLERDAANWIYLPSLNR